MEVQGIVDRSNQPAWGLLPARNRCRVWNPARREFYYSYGGKLMLDLFGHDDPPGVKRRGHAGQPGAGPQGETCKTCNYRRRVGHNKVFQKCKLMEHHWSHCGASDIRAKDPACGFWRKETEEAN